MVNISELCANWLWENFDVKSEILSCDLLDQNEIDKSLSLRGINIYFRTHQGVEGKSTAFFDMESIDISLIMHSGTNRLETVIEEGSLMQ